MLPIDPEVKTDAFYRYKMPAVQVKVEGSGNGIKTVFPNIHDICLAINRPEKVLMKFFQHELGTQRTVFDKDDKFLLMGSHTEERMQKIIYDFITKFVLCKKCRNPETRVAFAKSSHHSLTLVCGACGAITPMTEHRVLPVMAAHYSKIKNQAPKAAKGSAEAGRREGDVETMNEEVDDAAADAATATDKSSAAAAAAAPTTTTNADAAPAPTAAEGAQDVGKGLKDEREHPAQVLKRYMKEYGNNMDELLANTVHLVLQYNLPEEYGPILLLETLLLDHKEDLLSAIQRYATLFRRFATVPELYYSDETYEEKEQTEFQNRELHIQTFFLKACAKKCADLFDPEKMAVLVFMLFIDGIVRDRSIAQWAQNSKPNRAIKPSVEAAMKEKVMPIVSWLGLEVKKAVVTNEASGEAAEDRHVDPAAEEGGDDAMGRNKKKAKAPAVRSKARATL